MILTNFIDNINDQRRDLTNTFISESEMIRYLNEGLRKVKGNYEYPWEKVSASFSYTDGSYAYQLSAIAGDLDEPINIFYDYQYPFTCVSPEEFGRLSAYGGYNIWAIDNDSLKVKTSFGTATLTLNYYTEYVAQTSAGSRTSGLSASTDSPLMPEIHQDIIVDYALSKCFKKEQMWDDYKIAYRDYTEALRKLQAKTPSRKKHYSKVMGSCRKAHPTSLSDKGNLV